VTSPGAQSIDTTGITQFLADRFAEEGRGPDSWQLRLVNLHAKDKYYDGCVICDNGNNSCGCMGGWHWKYPCDTLKLLALHYAEHPDYKPEWRP
jgi:hypothetical protein